MNDTLKLQILYMNEIDRYERMIKREKSLAWEKIHSGTCARLGYMLAEKRGVDTKLATVACAMHDYGRVITGEQEGHAEAGYKPAREFLTGTGILNAEEVETVAVAIKNHSKKSEIGNPVEEIVKDADCLDFHMHGYELPRQEQRDRLSRLLDKTVD